jgi:hypothetical protein
VREVFDMVWGAKEIIVSLENSLYITADISMRHFGPIVTPTVFVYAIIQYIIVKARMSALDNDPRHKS